MRSPAWRCWPLSSWSRRWSLSSSICIYKGASSLNLDFFTKVPKPPGEVGGGMANAIVGSGGAAWPGQPHRRSHRHRRRHLPGRVRPRDQAGQCDSLHRRRAQRRSLDRDGRCRLCADRQPAHQLSPVHGALLGLCRRRGAGHHDDSHRHPHHRRDAADGAASRSAKPRSAWACPTGARFSPSR